MMNWNSAALVAWVGLTACDSLSAEQEAFLGALPEPAQAPYFIEEVDGDCIGLYDGDVCADIESFAVAGGVYRVGQMVSQVEFVDWFQNGELLKVHYTYAQLELVEPLIPGSPGSPIYRTLGAPGQLGISTPQVNLRTGATITGFFSEASPQHPNVYGTACVYVRKSPDHFPCDFPTLFGAP